MSTAEFGTLINQQDAFLMQLAMKLSKRIEEAEDLIQETYFKALKNKDKYEQGTNLKGWLYTIMKNTFINSYRRKKYQNTHFDETENQYYLNSAYEKSGRKTDGSADHDYVMKQVEALEDNYRIAFMMHYEGYKYDEIAEHLDIPLGTVKSRIFLARKKLSSKLEIYRYN